MRNCFYFKILIWIYLGIITKVSTFSTICMRCVGGITLSVVSVCPISSSFWCWSWTVDWSVLSTFLLQWFDSFRLCDISLRKSIDIEPRDLQDRSPVEFWFLFLERYASRFLAGCRSLNMQILDDFSSHLWGAEGVHEPKLLWLAVFWILDVVTRWILQHLIASKLLISAMASWRVSVSNWYCE